MITACFVLFIIAHPKYEKKTTTTTKNHSSMFSPRSFIVLIATFRSMIQINFVCAVSLMSKFTVFHIRI